MKIARIVYWGVSLSGVSTSINFMKERLEGSTSMIISKRFNGGFQRLVINGRELDSIFHTGHCDEVWIEADFGALIDEETEKEVLRECHGIIWVVDCQSEMIGGNQEAKERLLHLLTGLGKEQLKSNIIIQYNKKDLSNALSIEIIEGKLNLEKWLHVESIAIEGKGVFESLRLVLEKVEKSIGKG